MRAARTAAAASAAAVEVLDRQLASNDKARREQKAMLKGARDRIAELERSLKDAKAMRKKWRTARKEAARKAQKAQQRADLTEEQYDQAVLDDMLRQKKKQDLAEHSGPSALGVRSP